MSSEKELHLIDGADGPELRYSDLGATGMSTDVLATQGYVVDISGLFVSVTTSQVSGYLAAGLFSTILSPGLQATATAATATADGMTTGIVPDSTSFVQVTSANANNIITLPTPTPGTIVRLLNGATGYELRTSTPASVAINGGTGAAAESAIGANVYVEAMCVSPTAWIARQYTTAGVQSATEVAAP